MDEESTRGNLADASADLRGSSGWVTTKVAAEALGVDPRTVRTYINRGELDAKVEGEDVEKPYLVAIDSLHALRVLRGFPRKTRAKFREESAKVVGGVESAEDYAVMVRDLADRLIR